MPAAKMRSDHISGAVAVDGALAATEAADTASFAGALQNYGTMAADEGVHVHPLGFVDDERLKVLAYSAADLFVHPAPVDNLPNVVMEAIACGTPAIASDLSVFRELVGDAAIYVPALDVAAWVAALQQVSTDPELKHRAMEAAARVRCQFAWRTSAEATLGVLERAAREPRKLHL